MGSIQHPRIYFNGYSYWNPNTVNNNDYSPPIDTYDPPQAHLNWKYLRDQNPPVQTFEEFPPWAQKNIDYPPGRKLPPAEWGYFGGQQSGFVTDDEPSVSGPFSVPSEKTRTTGYTDVNGNYGNDPSVEPWVGQPLQFSPAKLVDVNPMSFWSSQVFSNQVALGTPSNGFTAPPVARMHSRFVSTAKRNYNSTNDLVIAANYGAVFQTCVENDPATLKFHGPGGPLREQIEAAFAAGARGLMLRFTAYSTLYFQGSAFDGMAPGDRYPLLEKMSELYQAYAEDPSQPKPISRAYSRVAGWIGIWMPGELVSVPGGRFLIPWFQNPRPGEEKKWFAVAPSNLTAEQYQPPPKLPPNTDAPLHAYDAASGAGPLGPATVEVEMDGDVARRFTLDLGNAIPERDSSGTKCDFGTVKLGLSDSKGNIDWVCEDVPYDEATYLRYGGLVDLPGNGITREQLLGRSFVLEVDSVTVENGVKGPTKRAWALLETLATAQTDTRGMYAEQPDPPFSDGDAATPGPGMPSTAPTLTLQVRFRGLAPGAYPENLDMKVGWEAYNYQIGSYEGAYPIAVSYRDASGQWVTWDGPAPVPGDGNLEVQVVSKQPGPGLRGGGYIPNLVFLPYASSQGGYAGAPFSPSQAAPSPVGIGSSFYTVIRCLNWDNGLAEYFDRWLEQGPALEQVTEAVWNFVFRTYFYTFPVMDFISSPEVFQNQYAIKSLARTDPAIFDTAGYMPVTRTWSAGQRHIMESYVKYLQSHQEAGVTARAESAAPPFEPPQPEGRVAPASPPPVDVGNLGHG